MPKLPALYLMVLHSESYDARIVSSDKLVDELAAATYHDPQSMPPEERQAWESDLADEANWSTSGDLGRTHFHAEIGEDASVSIFLIPGLQIVGALATIEGNQATGCPFAHVLHKSDAGAGPVTVYGVPLSSV